MILLTTRLYHPIQGGSVHFVDQMASAYIKSGWPVTVATRTGASDPEPPRAFPVIRRPSFAALWRLTARASIVHQVETSLQDAIPALLQKKPLIITHQQPYEIRSGFQGVVDRAQKYLQNFVVPVAVGPGVQRSWGTRGCLIPNPYDSEIFFPDDDENNRSVDFLFAGRFLEGKGILLFLDALKLLGNSFRRAMIIGNGPLQPTIQKIVAAPEFRNRVELLDWQTPQRVAECMRETKIFVLPSYEREGLPLALVEAIASGCLPITTRVNEIDEFFGEACAYAPPRSVKALAALMGETLQAWPAAKVRSQEAREKVISACALPEVAARYRALIASLCEVPCASR